MRYFAIAIVFAALTACSPPDETPIAAQGTLWVNINGYTPGNTGIDQFSEMLIDGDRITRIGNGELRKRHPNLSIYDGQGKTVLPGLIDAHGHISSLGRAFEQIELSDTRSLDSALGKIVAFAEANPEAPWILGRGWNQELWSDQRFPTRQDLDAVLSDRPVWLTRIDGHAGWGNSQAFIEAGINADTKDPDGGRILRAKDGSATGVLVDAASYHVEKVIPEASQSDSRRYLRNSLERLASLGITSAHDAGVSVQEVDVLKAMADDEELPVRVYAMLSGADEVLDAVGQPLIDYADAMLSIRSVKLYADGALGSRGAALISDYSDEPGHKGLLFTDASELAEKVTKTNKAGFQANVHAIGDLANRVVIDAFEQSAKITPAIHRNRIEHAQILTLDDIQRMKTLDIIASIQPTHATSDMNMAEQRLGADRMAGAYAWQNMLASGIVVAAGSDFPVEPANPMFGLHAAVTRSDRNNQPLGGWYSKEAMTREQALIAFTKTAAYAAHQESLIGQLQAGFKADFIVIDRDYFEIPAEEIWKIQVLQTWVNGMQVYPRP